MPYRAMCCQPTAWQRGQAASYNSESLFFPPLLAHCSEKRGNEGPDPELIDGTQNLPAGFGFIMGFGSSSAFNIFHS